MKLKTRYLMLPIALLTSSVFGNPKPVHAAEVDQLLIPYFPLQIALSVDNLTKTHANAGQLLTLLDKIGSGETIPSVTELRQATENLASSRSLDEAREAFKTLSLQMIELIEKEGTSGNSAVYRMSCSMAFEGSGAEWLQNNRNVTNPYFGVRMFSCGTIEKQLAGAVAMPLIPANQGSGCSAGGCCQK